MSRTTVPAKNHRTEITMQTAIARRGGNVQHCAKAFGLSELALRTAVKMGEVRSHVSGKKTVILYSAIEAWVNTLPQPKAPCKRINNNTNGESHVY
jgi:hypothetical protein